MGGWMGRWRLLFLVFLIFIVGFGVVFVSYRKCVERLAVFNIIYYCVMDSFFSRRVFGRRYKEFWSFYRIFRVCSFVGYDVDGVVRC